MANMATAIIPPELDPTLESYGHDNPLCHVSGEQQAMRIGAACPFSVPPIQFGCDALALTCSAAATVAISICVTWTASTSATFDGDFLFIIPVSGSAEATTVIHTCGSASAGAIIGVSNDFPSAIRYAIYAGTQTHNWSPFSREVPYNWASDVCITDIQVMAGCGDNAAFFLPYADCVYGEAYVQVNGRDGRHANVPTPIGSLIIGSSTSHAFTRAGPCVSGLSPSGAKALVDEEPSSAPNTEAEQYEIVSWGQFTESSRNQILEDFRAAADEAVEEQVSSWPKNETHVAMLEQALTGAIERTIVPGDLVLWARNL